MKIKVVNDPSETKSVRVRAVNVITGKPLMCIDANTLRPGESCEVVVNAGQSIRVDAIITPSPNAGGGPGDPPVPV